jgi:DNA processing protein
MSAYHYLQLQAARGIGPALQRRLLTHMSERGLTLAEFMSFSKRDWQQAGLSSDQADALQSAEDEAQRWADAISEKNIVVIGLLEDSYPADLRRVLGNKTPPILCAWGNLDLLHGPAVGFCGARDASEQGIAFTVDTAGQIAKKGWTIISGHARGVDQAAHRTALVNNGNTIIVAPVGLLNFQLKADLRELMEPDKVLIVSEFQPNARWSVANAMTRNRTICGLSDALIIVESGASGGTFEAGQFALTVQVPLFVAEYAHPAPSAAGNPYFIQRGAKPIRRSKETGRANLEEFLRSVETHLEEVASPPVAELIQGLLF